MSDWKAKRFWKETAVEKVAEGFEIKLDGRSVKTPAKRALILPTQAMAKAVAAEWDAQEGEIIPHKMPATKTANAAIDKVLVQHREVAEMLAAYGDSDLLCYRAEAPEELVTRQHALWDPMLDWAQENLGVQLGLRTGVMHQPQEAAALQVLRDQTRKLSAFELAAFHDLVSLTGSLILGFATTRQARPPEEIWELSRLDETWQAEQWGSDDEAEEMARIKKASFLHAARMFMLCRAG
ncbi:ATPase [Sulfitobacter sp. F26204]|uniref:ATP12 family chaperone protein n=1 Tax=Sulfitobacter sp. F26204 TaxID=2996014 RepID=UPI00225DF8F7|nr:ATP12 family protein [Sulfitobacter sp. F26204]MCX7558716.1 ATPase [Sulfitobacter sp. F26204]